MRGTRRKRGHYDFEGAVSGEPLILHVSTPGVTEAFGFLSGGLVGLFGNKLEGIYSRGDLDLYKVALRRGELADDFWLFHIRGGLRVCKLFAVPGGVGGTIGVNLDGRAIIDALQELA